MAGPGHSYHCRGCDVLFTKRGYKSHLHQSKDPLCRLFHKSRSETARSSHSPASSDALLDDSTEPDPIAFPGDVFGTAEDYAEMGDDFGQNDDLDMMAPVDGVEVVDTDELGPQNDDTEDEMIAELEADWEPDREGAPLNAADNTEGVGGLDEVDELEDVTASLEARLEAESCLVDEGNGVKPKKIVRYSDKYPLEKAGEVVAKEQSMDSQYEELINGRDNPWAPFTSRIDWGIAKWAKIRGAGSTSFSDLLGIEGMQESLGLSYKNSDELNRIIDEKLPSRPKFARHEVVIHDEAVEFYSRDPMECLRTIWGDPEFADQLVFQPERHYSDEDELDRMFHDMHTGKWWWKTQQRIAKYTGQARRTVVPVIISSDKTQLTQFRNITAYPVYLTIGNLPKHIRRKPSRQGQVLLAYLPTTKLQHIPNAASRRRALGNLFHACMKYILSPLEHAGREGVIFVSGDGAARHCHPIFATYIGDYPEQILVTLVKSGLCPVCPAERQGMGEPESILEPRSARPILKALDTMNQGPAAFAKACTDAGIKPVQQPFWKDLPFVNVYKSITPDLLHQLYQGFFKHVVGWIREACGDTELDARCRRLPPNHHIRLFMKGISHLSRVTGQEHDQISRFLLGLIVDIRLPDGLSNKPLIRAVRGMLDFMYLARYPIHTSQTLTQLDDALQSFHENKEIFVTLGIRQHFDIPKIHYTGHYRMFIELFGTADNFNTEYTERLHIDMAKDAYAATNKKDEYPQMTAWLDRREKIMLHEKYVQRRVAEKVAATTTPQLPKPTIPLPSLVPTRKVQMAKHPTHKAVPLDIIQTKYGATHFKAALARFVTQRQHPGYLKAEIEVAASTFHIPFTRIPVYHRMKFVSQDAHSITPSAKIVVDSLHVEPARFDKYRKVVPARFDTAVINWNNGGPAGVSGYCVGRVRCIFRVPTQTAEDWFPGEPIIHLAYVEWFTPFSAAIFDPSSRLYRISPLLVNRERQASVIPITYIRQSVHLFPKFGPIAPAEWKSSNVLDLAKSFYVNPMSDRFPYSTLY